jgi:hypothetical protein
LFTFVHQSEVQYYYFKKNILVIDEKYFHILDIYYFPELSELELSDLKDFENEF